MPAIKAAIFDFDGLMSDTERYGFHILQRIVADYGEVLLDDQFPHVMGQDQFRTAEYVVELTGIPLTPDHFNDLYVQHFYEDLDQLSANPGLLELLADLERRGLPLGIASNSPTDYLEKLLAHLHVRGFFRVLVGRDQVPNGKPAPDVYLRAAALLGVDPLSCLAVEDSPVGLQSALNAGMTVAPVNEENVFGERARFRSLGELRERLEEVLRMKDEG
jgi:HAD superfamily hydrolase (TIGR01509 family)